MTYFAGNTSKFMNGGVDVTQLTDVSQAIEAMDEAAELNARHARNLGTLNAYSNQQDALFRFNLGQDLRQLQREADNQSKTLEGLGKVVSAGGDFIQGLNRGSSNPFGLPNFNFEDSVSNLPSDAFTNPPISFSDAMNMSQVSDVDYSNSFTGLFKR